jgi:hypothetical protein
VSFKQKLRKVLLCVFLGGSFFGAQMSHEKIAELLNAANQPRAEETIADENEIGELKKDVTASETGHAGDGTQQTHPRRSQYS